MLISKLLFLLLKIYPNSAIIIVLFTFINPARVRVLGRDCHDQFVIYIRDAYVLLSQFVVGALFCCVKTAVVPYFIIYLGGVCIWQK